MNSVTSNAAAQIGKTAELLYNYTSYSTQDVTLAQSIENFTSIVVEVGNTENPSCKCIREYNAVMLKNNYLGRYLQDIAGFNEGNIFYVRYCFYSATKIAIKAFNGTWSFGTCRIYGIK